MITRSRRTPHSTPRRLVFDVLEDRTVLAATVIGTIPVGVTPLGVAVDTGTNRIYVAEHGSDRVSVIDGTTNTVSATIPVGPQPVGVVVDAATHRVFVVFVGGTTDGVAVIDGAPGSPTENTVVATIPVPGRQLDVARAPAFHPATNRVYVPSFDPGGAVVVIDATTNSLHSIIPVAANPMSAAVDPVTNTVYIGHGSFFGRTRLTRIDGLTHSVTDGPQVGFHSADIASDPTTGRFYVHKGDIARGDPIEILAIDGATNTVISPRIPGGQSPFGGVGINTTNHRVYVADSNTNDLSVIDGTPGSPTENQIIDTVPVGTGSLEVAVNAITSRIYVTDHDSNTVTVIEDREECVAVPAGLVAWWSGEGDASDRAGTHHGTLVSGVTFAPGRVGQAFRLDGSDDYLRVPHDPALNPAAGLTIEAWIRSESTAGPRVIASKWNDSTSNWSYIFKDHNASDKLRIELSSDFHNDLADLSGTTSIPTGTWTHVAATFDGSAVRLYFNGVEDARLDVGSNRLIDSSATDFLIGAGIAMDGVREHFAGLIDELAVYNRALSGAELHSIYRAAGAGKCVNRPPTAVVGGPQTIAEGSSLTLDASPSTDPDADSLSYSWDVNGDGVFGDATGVNPTLSWNSLALLGVNDGPFHTANLRVQVDDGHGHIVASEPTSLTVVNVAPVLGTIATSSPGCGGTVAGAEVTVSGLFSDLGILDRHSATIDWGDGTVETLASISEENGEGSLVGRHVYADGGSYLVKVTLSDDDGASATSVATALITGAGVHDGTLRVIGTNQADHVIIYKLGHGRMMVHASFLPGWRFKSLVNAGISDILIELCDGNDFVTISEAITLPAVMNGGDGNDFLNGGGGMNVILGGLGNDFLVGGRSNDLLIGGAGRDFLLGNAGDDVLVGGTTDFDEDIDAILGLLLDPSLLSASDVHDDDKSDVLIGGAGRDSFFAQLDGPFRDFVVDEHALKR